VKVSDQIVIPETSKRGLSPGLMVSVCLSVCSQLRARSFPSGRGAFLSPIPADERYPQLDDAAGVNLRTQRFPGTALARPER
jgi:hypothetical protein